MKYELTLIPGWLSSAHEANDYHSPRHHVGHGHCRAAQERHLRGGRQGSGDPIPAQSSRTQIEQAAIKFSRKILHRQWGHLTGEGAIGVNTISRLYLECLIAGTPLDADGSQEEKEQRFFDQEKREELARLAKEEAKAERAKAKAAKAADKK